MNSQTEKRIVEALVESLEIPNSAYLAAERRYKDLGEWLCEESNSRCARYNPRVFPQGSFRLGTAVRPWKREDYDLDLSCSFQDGLTKSNHTQKQIKKMLQVDLEAYRIARNIKELLEERHRCWRLLYQDELSFHMDAVPSIPEATDVRRVLYERMMIEGLDFTLAESVAQQAQAITDNRHPDYATICSDWQISNPEGFAKWFESRMRQATSFLQHRAMMEAVATVDDLPTYQWKTPLQRCVQILKRHRDVMFERAISQKPISVIITTLAARSYNGEEDVAEALENILTRMAEHVNRSIPRVPNPVNPVEDFADKWPTPEGKRLDLEGNFWQWLQQAQADFDNVRTSRSKDYLTEQVAQRFGVRLDQAALLSIPGVDSSRIYVPKSYDVSSRTNAKPWSQPCSTFKG